MSAFGCIAAAAEGAAIPASDWPGEADAARSAYDAAQRALADAAREIDDLFKGRAEAPPPKPFLTAGSSPVGLYASALGGGMAVRAANFWGSQCAAIVTGVLAPLFHHALRSPGPFHIAQKRWTAIASSADMVGSFSEFTNGSTLKAISEFSRLASAMAELCGELAREMAEFVNGFVFMSASTAVLLYALHPSRPWGLPEALMVTGAYVGGLEINVIYLQNTMNSVGDTIDREIRPDTAEMRQLCVAGS